MDMPTKNKSAIVLGAALPISALGVTYHIGYERGSENPWPGWDLSVELVEGSNVRVIRIDRNAILRSKMGYTPSQSANRISRVNLGPLKSGE